VTVRRQRAAQKPSDSELCANLCLAGLELNELLGTRRAAPAPPGAPNETVQPASDLTTASPRATLRGSLAFERRAFGGESREEGVTRVAAIYDIHGNLEVFTRLTPEDRLLPVFEGLDVPVVICGHTHMQFDRTVGSARVVNAGSVGMPYGAPGAYWLLLGPDVRLRRTPYDLARAAERIRDTTYPQAEEFAAGNVLRPPSEGGILAAFTPKE
jgi:diadenosine tetraphosphatase ApaH/serine/threonine PP2A family protein phosphatase